MHVIGVTRVPMRSFSLQGRQIQKMMSQHYKSGNYVTTKKAENGCIVPVRKMGLTLWPYMSSVSKLTNTKSPYRQKM